MPYWWLCLIPITILCTGALNWQKRRFVGFLAFFVSKKNKNQKLSFAVGNIGLYMFKIYYQYTHPKTRFAGYKM
jgi:hypothetical protein